MGAAVTVAVALATPGAPPVTGERSVDDRATSPAAARSPAHWRSSPASTPGPAPAEPDAAVAAQPAPESAPAETVVAAEVTTSEGVAGLSTARRQGDGTSSFRYTDEGGRRAVMAYGELPCWGSLTWPAGEMTYTNVGGTTYEYVLAITFENTGNRARTYVASSLGATPYYLSHSGPVSAQSSGGGWTQLSLQANTTLNRGETRAVQYVFTIDHGPGGSPGLAQPWTSWVITQDPAVGEKPC